MTPPDEQPGPTEPDVPDVPDVPGASGAPEASGGGGSEASSFIERLQSPRQHGEKYRLVDEIARGGMGIVQKIWDADLRRYLAKKVILVRGSEGPDQPDPRLLGRFLEEAQISGQLEHPGIVPVHEVGVDEDGRVFFTMQLVKGRELTDIFELVQREREGWSTTRALGVMLKVCDAMAYAHDKGVIHRDLKPANVMVGRFGEVYVMDWGLAHVLGEKGKKSKHKASTTMLTLDSAREQASQADGDSMRTMDGDVIGTPTFMSPQQARGRIADLDARADIYSVGAILYCLLAGRAPFVEPGVERGALAVLQDLLAGPPRPILEVNPDVPGELVAICEKAMARELKDRYRNMQELADDLRAFLENRVVQAFETGAVAELKKWVARNKGLATTLAASVLLAVGGLGAVVMVEARGRRAADAQRAIALANEVEAKANEAEAMRNAEQARLERANVLRLSAFQRLEDLQAEAELLWPPVPDRIPAYEAWMERAERLVAGLRPAPTGEDQGHYQQLAELRSRALPRDPQQDELHPRFAELTALREQLRALEAVRAVTRGGPPLAPFILDAQDRAATAGQLNQRAWDLVGPRRQISARDTEGLALARLALARAASVAERAQFGDTLAWALFRCGRDDEALEAGRTAAASAAPELREEYEDSVDLIASAIEARNGEAGVREVEQLEDSIYELEERIASERPWRFEDDNDRWWHAQLAKLVDELEAFADPDTGLVHGVSGRHGWGVARRLQFARQVEQRTMAGAAARQAWDEAIASIRDESACPQYRGLELTPQLGLLPIGRDPNSGLWEFVHVMTGSTPERREDGSLAIGEETGLVLVLVPGGTFSMGAQADDPSGPNFDPAADANEAPVHPVALDPFFVSKYEMSQGQWLRACGQNPSRYLPTWASAEWTGGLDHPVERVSWHDCDLWLGRMDLELPTEAQWEWAARGGTTTPWSTGAQRDSLIGACNLADQSAARVANWPAIKDWPEFDDGWPIHAPVGSYAANPLGLHDVHGNLREWCREARGRYAARVAAGDGLRIDTEQVNRIFRGGSFSTTAARARSSGRGVFTPELLFSDLGVRPSRSLR